MWATAIWQVVGLWTLSRDQGVCGVFVAALQTKKPPEGGFCAQVLAALEEILVALHGFEPLTCGL